MKLYLLVEGISSEMQAYPVWLNYFIPELTYHEDFEGFKQAGEGFFVISGNGYPSIINHINHSAQDVTDIGNVEVVIQNRCFETLLLANRKAIPRQPQSQSLIHYVQYYDVIENDPQAMGHFSDDFNHAQFHAEYAMKALREKRIRYSKSNCGDVVTQDFIHEIDKRIIDTNHLQSFAEFINQLMQIRQKIA